MDQKLRDLIRDALAAYDAMSPEQQAAMIEAQRKSWARAMAPCEHGVRDWEDCPKCRRCCEGRTVTVTDTSKARCAAEAADLRRHADNIGHSDRRTYPVGPLLDAADLIDALRAKIDRLHNPDEAMVEAVAIASFAAEDNCSVNAAATLLLAGKGAAHRGDCTDESMTCARCLYDDEMACTRAGLRALAAVLDKDTPRP